MPTAVSIQEFRKVTPAWLRPAAAGLVLFVHLLVLVGISWPSTTHLGIPRPLELQIVAQGRPVEAVSGVDTVQTAEVRPSDAPPSASAAEAQSVTAPEAPATTPTEHAAVKAAEPLSGADVPKEALPVTAQAEPELKPSNTAALDTATPAARELPLAETLAAADPARQEPAAAPASAAAEAKPAEVVQAAAPVATTVTATQPSVAPNAPTQDLAAVPTPPPTDLKAFEVAQAPSTNLVAPPAQGTEARPVVVAQAAAPVVTAAPMAEAPTAAPTIAAAVPPAVAPPLQNLLARPPQPIVETKPAETTQPAATVPVVPTSRETLVATAAPASEPAVVAPRNETPRPPAAPAMSEVKPFDVAQAASPVRTAPPARASPPTEAAPLTSQPAPSLAPGESIEAETVPVNLPPTPDPAELAAIEYRIALLAELSRLKRYPESARVAKITGVVLAAFTIEVNGQVSAITITRSSGHTALDTAVRQLLNALSLPPPPAGPIRVDLPVEFKAGG